MARKQFWPKPRGRGLQPFLFSIADGFKIECESITPQ